MNLVDALLAADKNQLLNTQTKEYEVTRLSNILGQPFILTLKAISSKRYTEIQGMAVRVKKNGSNEINLYQLQILTLGDGIQSPSLNSPELLKHFNVASPADLLNKLLLAGEISDIAGEISKLSGYDNIEENVEEVKN